MTKMLRRWKGRSNEAPDRAAPEEEDDEDGLGDLASRLDAVTARPNPDAHTIPTGRTRRQKEAPPPPEPPHEKSFSEQFTNESLFMGAADDPSDSTEFGHNLDSRAYYDPENPWDVLGVSTSADWKTIVAAHRKLAIRYHPDRLHDLPDDERARAEDNMRVINVAYTTLQRMNGKP